MTTTLASNGHASAGDRLGVHRWRHADPAEVAVEVALVREARSKRGIDWSSAGLDEALGQLDSQGGLVRVWGGSPISALNRRTSA